MLIDDRPVGVTSWTGELLPGSHRVTLKLDDYESASQVFELRADRSLDVTVPLTAKGPGSTPVVPVAPEPPPSLRHDDVPPPTSPSALVPIGVTTAALGLCSFGVAIGLEVGRAGAENAARKAPIQIDAQSHVTTMQNDQLGARIAAGVGGGLVVAGGAMLAVGLAMRPSKGKGTPSVSAFCVPGTCAAAVAGTF